MFATMTAVATTDGDSAPALAAPALTYHLAPSRGEPATSFRVWTQELDARVAVPGEPVWTVAEHHRGRCADDTPTVVQVHRFDGPRSEKQAAADRRAGMERIWPAVADLDGLVDVYVLTHEQRGMSILIFVTAAGRLESLQRRVMATELLPDEDPALLSEPDRTDVHQVTRTARTTAGAR